jgi:predicted DNA-binding protein
VGEVLLTTANCIGDFMSLEKKSTHVRLSPENHERAKVLSNIKGKDLAQYLAYLLEKEIAGEWHVLNLQAKSFERLGVSALLRELSTEVEFHEDLKGLMGI